jgi:homogentisate 1,2-dioxygenase
MNASIEKGFMLREFPWKERVRTGFESRISRLADGSPPDGLYIESRNFDTFLCRTEPLTVVNKFDSLIPFEPKSMRKARIPRAFRLSNASYSNKPEVMLKSSNMTISSFFVNNQYDTVGLRNVDGSEVLFVHKGNGHIITDFGYIPYEAGDYVFIPKGTIYYVSFDSESLFVIAEISKQVFLPRHYWLSDFFPFSSSAIIPAIPVSTADDFWEKMGGSFDVLVKIDGAYRTRLEYSFNPFNCVKWEGKLYPFKLSLENIHTLVSPTFHLPPTAFITFVTEDLSVLISTFKPRWIHSLPYNHVNDHDEFLFYHSGDYGARTGIKSGDASLHPVGMHHGPQPKKLEEWEHSEPQDLPWRDEVAIMFESRAPLEVYSEGDKVEIPDYSTSWAQEWREINDK